MERLIAVPADHHLHPLSGWQPHPQRAGSGGSVIIGRSAAGRSRTYRLARPGCGRSAVDAPPRVVAAAYRRLLVVLLGLDPSTLASHLRAERLSRSPRAVQPTLAA
jgi:hypothetical protein